MSEWLRIVPFTNGQKKYIAALLLLIIRFQYTMHVHTCNMKV